MNRKLLFFSGIVLILLSFIIAMLLYQNQGTALQSASVIQNRGILERQGAPVKGPNDAKVTIVEFFDPACGTCVDFYPFLNQLIGQYPGKVRVMMRYIPFYTGSEEIVKMLEAAHHQGKYWQALELLFNNQHRWAVNHVPQPMQARSILNDLAMDHEKLDADMDHPEITRAIQQDVKDSQALNVWTVPKFFVNGRPLPSFGYEQLSQLVKEAVDEAY